MSQLSLTERIFKVPSGARLPVTSPFLSLHRPQSLRPEFYKQWDDDKMQRAMKSVLEEGLSIRRAAEHYDVPRSTLNDRIQGKVIHGSRSGPSRYLNDAEEEELVLFLLRSSSIGYPRSRNEVIALVQRVCYNKGLSVTVTHGWWEGFCRRNPSIALRTPAQVSLARAKATDPEVLHHYFDLLESTMIKYSISDKPAQIFNMDETGVPLNPDPQRGVYKKGSKNPVAITSGDKSQFTVVGCVSAAGYCIPPMIILDRKTLHPDMTIGELPGTIYGLSSKGWIDSELFHMWFNDHFLRYAPPVRPLLLLMDGHSTHFCPDTIRLAAEKDVVLFTLPPNTTHIAQPLDKGCFGPLKTEWKKVCHDYLVTEGRVVTRYSFSKLFSKAWMQSMTMRNILSGFRVTGICPLDRTKLTGKDETRELTEKIPFNPMISHSPFPVRKHKSFDKANDNSEVRSDEESDKESDEGKVKSSPYDKDVKESIHNDESDLDHVLMAKQTSRPLKDTLSFPSTLPKVIPHQQQDAHLSRVITSHQNLDILAEKQRLKDEKARLMEEKKKLREEKKKLKEDKAREKQKLREEKARERQEKQKLMSDKARVREEKYKGKVLKKYMYPKKTKGKEDIDDDCEDDDCEESDIDTEDNCEDSDSDNSDSNAVGVIEKPVTLNGGIMTRRRKALLIDEEVEVKSLPKKKTVQFRKRNISAKKTPISRVRSQGGKEKDLLMKKGERNANAGVDVHVTETDMEKEEEVSQDEVIPKAGPLIVGESTDSDADEDDDWIKELGLKKDDFFVLKDGDLLSDRIINASQLLLKNQYHIDGLQNTLRGKNLSFRPICKSDACIVQILHTGVSHWLCIVVKESKSACIVNVMDSASSNLNETTILQIANVVKTNKPFFKIVELCVQQQQGVTDCGVFAVAFATAICTGSNVQSVSFNQSKMRAHLLECFENRKMAPFPSCLSNVKTLKKSQTLKVFVYCTCRLPDFYDKTMIQCDSCKNWYHATCVKVNVDSVSDWECIECSPL